MSIGTYTATTSSGWSVQATVDTTTASVSYIITDPDGNTYYGKPNEDILNSLQAQGYSGTSLPAGLTDAVITSHDQAKAIAVSDAAAGIDSSAPVPITPENNPNLTSSATSDTPIQVVTAPTTLDIANTPDVNANIVTTAPPIITSPNSGTGITAAKTDAQATPANQDQTNAVAQADWRVRVALSQDPSVTYLYKDPKNVLLSPLNRTNGVIFPYTPTISVSYDAQYDPTTLVHSNYKVFQYGSSSIDNISIAGDFTCQDVAEANYVMAVIHFFRTMTKMFYGQDTNPKPGTPPPLCYLYGLGQYQFAGQPMAIQSFTYTTPPDVDYIATTGPASSGSPQKNINPNANSNSRIGAGSQLAVGGTPQPVTWPSSPVSAGQGATYVPTKINMSISCVPMMSRNQVSNQFSLTDYASGKLLKGTQNGTGAFW